MSFVRFATVCDKCHKRSQEYQAFPYCRECGKHICSDCRSLDHDDQENGTGICDECAIGEPHEG
jgi:hypothetical protein